MAVIEKKRGRREIHPAKAAKASDGETDTRRRNSGSGSGTPAPVHEENQRTLDHPGIPPVVVGRADRRLWVGHEQGADWVRLRLRY